MPWEPLRETLTMGAIMAPRHTIRFDLLLLSFALTCMPMVSLAAQTSSGSPVDVQGNLPQEWQDQYERLQDQLQQRDTILKRAPQAYRPDALILPEDRDPADIVLRRTEALLRDLRSMPNDPDLSQHIQAMEYFKKLNETKDVNDSRARHDLYMDACRLRRVIAFANPLLDFDQLLFVTHHRSIAPYSHMCDQYYGCFAKSGGGLYVLADPFGDQPRLRDVLEGATVEGGRLKGRELTPGSFLSPDLSYDGETILFAYTETTSTKTIESGLWTPEVSFHVYRVNVDGSGLMQLTDGPWDDFDPCWLPDGCAAFISERRGGYLRCGYRACPTYTLHAMNADGSDITTLSYHETHEWHPSVNNDGLLVYTRWDYVDRDTNVAHHPWLTTPDGRDARAIHGNYPGKRQDRPWMEMDIRAIPGSPKYVATSAPHHGQAYGSLVVFDPAVSDDGAMAPVRRLTPEAEFPEAESGKAGIRADEVYGTAWPLSEDYFLCVYDPGAENHGIYLLDSFGNKELIYRDPQVSCLSPMPLRARSKPPVISPIAQGTRPPVEVPIPADETATVAVMNVYDSRFPIPDGTEIKALRLIKVLPKTTPSSNLPRIGAAQQTNARAVLGTVPVEPDGSAYFEMPVNRAIYFQALDERGLAVQSMRSVTYVHPGEHLTCQGCHERRNMAPGKRRATAAALQRPPSTIQPDVDGSSPFSYPRLVQPVLDKHCASCHTKHENAPDLSGTATDTYGWTASYTSLATDYGFYYNVFNGAFNDPYPIGGARTIPSEFGAKASKLYKMLTAGHHDVTLPDDDLYRITLWLDCNSEFYGSYENIKAQTHGGIVMPTLE